MEKNQNYLTQVIVVRKDLNMPSLKMAAMVAHAAHTFLNKRLKDRAADQYDPPDWSIGGLSADQVRWLSEMDPGLEDLKQESMAKIVLWAKDLDELLTIEERAKAAGMTCHRVVDCGYSHNPPKTLVCIALGPHWKEQFKPIAAGLSTR